MTLTQPDARRYRELAKQNLRGLLFKVASDTDAAPDTPMRDAMINTALQAAKTELFGQCKFYWCLKCCITDLLT
jgi:hypothetical protein